MREQGIVEFFRLIRQTRPAKRAERAAAGYLPSRGLRYCDALTSATGYGYWVFPPLDIRLIWNGEEIFWSYGPDESWLPLSGTDSGAVQFPNYATAFDATAPEFLHGYSPPFLTALPEQGGVQMWTGLLARTRPGWSLSVRSPVNLPPKSRGGDMGRHHRNGPLVRTAVHEFPAHQDRYAGPDSLPCALHPGAANPAIGVSGRNARRVRMSRSVGPVGG